MINGVRGGYTLLIVSSVILACANLRVADAA